MRVMPTPSQLCRHHQAFSLVIAGEKVCFERECVGSLLERVLACRSSARQCCVSEGSPRLSTGHSDHRRDSIVELHMRRHERLVMAFLVSALVDVGMNSQR